MSKLNEAKKRDFVSQMIELVDQEKERLLTKGFDATAGIEELKTKRSVCDRSEAAQQEAAAKAMEATAVANRDLDAAYKEASNMANVLSGLLGMDDEMVRKMRKFRN